MSAPAATRTAPDWSLTGPWNGFSLPAARAGFFSSTILATSAGIALFSGDICTMPSFRPPRVSPVFQFHGQGLGLDVPSEFLSMLPYLATIVVLVIICRNPQTILLNKPMSLGQGFKAD